MVTGIEAVGLLLAIVPLLVNQLDNYVQGLETIKSFQNRRYRRELRGYLTRLETQQAILLNTLEQSLEGVVDYEDEISELIRNPQGPLWKDPTFQAKLRGKLGRDYDAFKGTMTELSDLLENLSSRLGLTADNVPPTHISWSDASAVEQEIKRFKTIFSKSIYDALLDKVDNANNALKTLIEQSHERTETRIRRQTSKKPLLQHRTLRRHARNLYNVIIQGKCWNCPCQDRHLVHFQIATDPLGNTDTSDVHPELPRFRLVFSPKMADESVRPLWPWWEIETEPVSVGSLLSGSKNSVAATKVIPESSRKPTVRFAMAALESVPWPKADTLSPPSPISDMCSILYAANTNNERRCIGCVSDEADVAVRYDMHLVGNFAQGLHLQSLEDLLWSSPSPMKLNTYGCSMFSRRDRLYLAARLACSVLQFHGSWLKDQWSNRDILIATDRGGTKSFQYQPYLSGKVLGKPEVLTTSPLIRNEILFPLGLALVELSLCRTIYALRVPEDDDMIEAVANLKTASRHLQDVYHESGTRYGDVVDRCLFWPGTRETKLDDEVFEESILDTIVTPLLDVLRDFEGRPRVYQRPLERSVLF